MMPKGIEDAGPDSWHGGQRVLGGLLLVLAGLLANPWLAGSLLADDGLINQPRFVGMAVALEVLLVLAGALVVIRRHPRLLALVGVGGVALGAIGSWEYRVYEQHVERVAGRRSFQQRRESRRALLARAIRLDRGPFVEFGTESSEVAPGLHRPQQILKVDVPPDGVLDTAIAVDPLLAKFFHGSLVFEIEVRADEADEKKLYSKTWNVQSPGKLSPFQWVPIHLNLSSYAGRTIELVFRRSYTGDDGWRTKYVYDLEPTDLAVWRKPIVRSRRLEHRKNLVLISVDTLRADHLHFMGYERATSPKLDRLAADGVVFDECISQAPWTTPSHFSILTGTYPSTNGSNQPLDPHDLFDPVTLGGQPRTWNPRIPPLAVILGDQGYKTAAFTGAGPISASFGFYKGFDSYNETTGALGGEGAGTDAREIANKATEWIHRNRDRSFFLFVHTFEVHQPYTHDDFAREAAISRSDPLAYEIARYDSDLRFADRQIGRVIDAVRVDGLLQNTLIVFTSDHGEELGEGAPRGYSFLGHGHSLYDELLHVPLVFRGLTAQPVAKRFEWQVRSIDILPTILDDLGVAKPDTVQGQSLLPMIRGKDSVDRAAYSEATTYGTERESLRTPAFKYVHRISYGEITEPSVHDFPLTPLHELYDLRHDPGEIHNVAGSQPAILRRMERVMKMVRPSSPLSMKEEESTPVVSMSPEVIENLRRLGYIH
jgi:arylsulfatase A-like enzyme